MGSRAPPYLHPPPGRTRPSDRTIQDPDEFVWSYLKSNGLSKKPLRQNESLRERVQSDLATIKSNRTLVKSFFGAKSVAYAKD